LSQITRVTDGQTDRRTDGRTEFSSLYRVCITCSVVKRSLAIAKKPWGCYITLKSGFYT